MTRAETVTISTVILLLVAAQGPLAAGDATAKPPANTSVRSAAGRPYRTYVNGVPGTDVTDNIQKAIDEARAAGGGTVMLPNTGRLPSGCKRRSGRKPA